MERLFAGGLFGWALVLLGVVAFFGLVWVRRREQLLYLVFAGFCLMALVHCVGSGLMHLAADVGSGEMARTGFGLLLGSAVVNMPLALHFGLLVVNLRWWVLLRTVYLLAAGYLVAMIGGWWWTGAWEAPHRLDNGVLLVGVKPTVVTYSFYAVGLLTPLALTVMLGWAMRSGQRLLRPMVVSSLVLTLTVVHDLLALSTGQGMGTGLVPAGYMALAFGVSLTLVTRYTRLSDELERSRSDLEKRTAELGQSYEELQKTQGELVRREQLAVVGELAAVIAHEVRNPLAVINNSVANLKRDGIEPSDRATLLAIITEESARLNRLVGDLLSYARPVSPQRQPVHLGEFVERSVALLLPPGTGVSVKFWCDPALPIVQLDPGLMRQVIDNIVGNALQAMHDRGELRVRVETVNEPPHAVRIEIEDTGDGMDTLVRAQARTPFFTTRPSGTGLGLAIVDRIVEAHGGAMTLVSKPGQGTTVQLALPEVFESPTPLPSLGGRVIGS